MRNAFHPDKPATFAIARDCIVTRGTLTTNDIVNAESLCRLTLSPEFRVGKGASTARSLMWKEYAWKLGSNSQAPRRTCGLRTRVTAAVAFLDLCFCQVWVRGEKASKETTQLIL